ncbi:MAG: sialidase family protein [Thermodesulfobacteriota bacterium]
MDRRNSQLPATVTLAALLMLCAPADAQTVLLVGTEYVKDERGNITGQSSVLARSAGAWKPVDAGVDPRRALFVGRFGLDGTAWIGGRSGDGGPALLRSDDGGITWSDAQPVFDEALGSNYRIGDVAFIDRDNGWILVHSGLDLGPIVFRSQDRGRTWTRIVEEPGLPFSSASLSVIRETAAVELLRLDPLSPRVWLRDLKEGCVLGALVGQSPGNRCAGSANGDRQLGGLATDLFRPVAASGAGDRRWIAGQLARSPGRSFDRFVVYSAALGAPWELQTIRFPGKGQLRTLSFNDESAGVAAGTQLQPNVGPLVVYTRDGGKRWEIGSVPRQERRTAEHNH